MPAARVCSLVDVERAAHGKTGPVQHVGINHRRAQHLIATFSVNPLLDNVEKIAVDIDRTPCSK
jgi:hypothetical protein